MPGKAAKIALTEKQLAELQQIIASKTSPLRLVQRARLIVLAFEGRDNRAISAKIDLQRKQVGLWRRRWQQSFDALVAVECRESRAARRKRCQERMVLSASKTAAKPFGRRDLRHEARKRR